MLKNLEKIILPLKIHRIKMYKNHFNNKGEQVQIILRR